MIVAPERLVPGIIARHCATPTLSASFQSMSSILLHARLDAELLMTMLDIEDDEPPMTSAVATVSGLKR